MAADAWAWQKGDRQGGGCAGSRRGQGGLQAAQGGKQTCTSAHRRRQMGELMATQKEGHGLPDTMGDLLFNKIFCFKCDTDRERRPSRRDTAQPLFTDTACSVASPAPGSEA